MTRGRDFSRRVPGTVRDGRWSMVRRGRIAPSSHCFRPAQMVSCVNETIQPAKGSQHIGDGPGLLGSSRLSCYFLPNVASPFAPAADPRALSMSLPLLQVRRRAGRCWQPWRQRRCVDLRRPRARKMDCQIYVRQWPSHRSSGARLGPPSPQGLYRPRQPAPRPTTLAIR
jgi:hypothetical protein